MIGLEKSAERCAKKINSLGNGKIERYVVLKGGDSNQRKAFANELRPMVKMPVYILEQFPNTAGKILIELSDYV